MHSIIPAPVSRVDGDRYVPLGSDTTISDFPELFPEFAHNEGGHGDIRFVIGESPAPGGYTLEVTTDGIIIESDARAGLFAGAQSLRQLMGPVATTVPITRIVDFPRFEYRGVMLDVARHFFGVAEVKRFIDSLALLKLNHLHLHLTDDQGWRLQIRSWPELTGIGASTSVGGQGGGFYTQDDYIEIVRYAASRFITIVPEIDVPGHTNAALAAYASLNESGVATVPYEGVEVGFSSLWIDGERTYEFLDDVVRELAELTPGPYIHLGGDESLSTTEDDFLAFIARATGIVAGHGKTIIGWHEMGRSSQLPPGTIGQYWSFLRPQRGADDHLRSFVDQGGRVIMSPADVAYLDMKYDSTTELGLDWAEGPTSLAAAYEWDPATIIPGIGEAQLLGIEAPMWTETLVTMADVESLAFPRLAAIAEIAWSPDGERSFDELAPRLAAFGELLTAAGVHFYRAPGVDWRD